ncbi:MAG: hypothetical protein C0500_06230 [Sphingobium sp.]|nr:hypothetical protein [Sphingobium sp.]
MLMKTFWIIVSAIAASVALPVAPAIAFGGDGHRAICALAYRHLSTPARAEIDRLIALDSDFKRFEDSCSWADRVRGSTHPETAPFHILALEPNDRIVDAADCSTDGCVTNAINLHGEILADRMRPDMMRLEALKFFAHWVGDLHQPLHVSIKGNRGGNEILLLWRGERTSNLHRVWDSDILLDHMGDRWPQTPDGERWKLLVDELDHELALGDVLPFVESTPLAWAQESHDLVRSRSLAYAGASVGPAYVFGDSYYQRNIPIVRQRIKQAALRLAGVLNRMFTAR